VRPDDRAAASTSPASEVWHNNTLLLDAWQWDEHRRANIYIPRPLPGSHDGINTTVTKPACTSDPNEFAYLNAGKQVCEERGVGDFLPYTWAVGAFGPNMNCPTAILPLSGNRKQVIEKLDHMYPVSGGTHADVGLMWGLRTISPREDWRTFWGYKPTDKPSEWDSNGSVKIGILLTDGLNTEARDFEGYWGCTRDNRDTGFDDPATPVDDSLNCWQHPNVKRLDSNSVDRMMKDVCDAFKDTYDATLYTVMVDINDPSAVGKLTDCASTSDHAFNVTTGSLEQTFNAILGSMLRVSR
jgi:hypothetical protein